jgi:hypothetical protein
MKVQPLMLSAMFIVMTDGCATKPSVLPFTNPVNVEDLLRGAPLGTALIPGTRTVAATPASIEHALLPKVPPPTPLAQAPSMPQTSHEPLLTIPAAHTSRVPNGGQSVPLDALHLTWRRYCDHHAQLSGEDWKLIDLAHMPADMASCCKTGGC